jgi:hypothetical protein
MYDRDKKVENAETLERLLIAMDRLIEVVSKEESSKAILDSLKDKGAKDVKTVPTSDVRADDIKINRPSSSSGRAGSGVADINYSTINRLNTAFRALQGDLGAFQKTLMNSVVWGNKAQALATKVAGYSAEQISPIKSYKQAERWFLDKHEKGEGGLAGAYKSLGDRLAPDGEKLFEFLKQGFDPKSAGKVLTQRNKEALIAEAQRATMGPVVKPGTPGAGGAAAIIGGLDMGALARVAATVALGAAPIVLGKLIHAGALNQIEGNRPYSMLNGQLATDYAQYDMNKLLTGMRYAKGISPSMKRLLENESEFQKTLEPIQVAGGSIVNTILSGGTKAINTLLSPVSKVASFYNKLSNRWKGIIDEGLEDASEGATAGAILGGIVGLVTTRSLKGTLQGAAWGSLIGGAAGATYGTVAEAITERRRKELDNIMGDPNDAAKRGMIGKFALEILQVPVCPPRRFVP